MQNTFWLPGIDAEILDENGKNVKPGEKGYIVIKKPWPGDISTLENEASVEEIKRAVDIIKNGE